MPLSKCGRLCWAALIVALLAGCGNDHGLASGSGRVTLNGEPIEGATVEFQPTFDGGSSSFGITDADGNYALKLTRNLTGVMPGEHIVRIFYQQYDGDDIRSKIPRKDIPPRYNVESELRIQIEPGSNSGLDFELEP